MQKLVFKMPFVELKERFKRNHAQIPTEPELPVAGRALWSWGELWLHTWGLSRCWVAEMTWRGGGNVPKLWKSLWRGRARRAPEPPPRPRSARLL